MDATQPTAKVFFSSRALRLFALIALAVTGLGIRLYDLTDLPLDFHPTRQLLSALKARGMYYQRRTDVPEWKRDFAVREWKFRAEVEPEVFERVVAFTYRFTGEQVWVARIYSSLFWTAGALFLFLLARKLASTDGALVATAFYLLLPYAVIASRSFQPDPLMVMLIVMFWWSILRWAQTTSRQASAAGGWALAILAGLSGGLAIYVKFVAAFFIIGGGLGALLGREPLRETLRRPQAWTIIALGLLPGLAYLIYGVWIAGFLGQQFGGRFFPSLFFDPSYYAGWLGVLNLVIGPAALTLGLLGLFFIQDGIAVRFVLGLWIGYLLLGLYFNYHISTHDYYSLPLIPIVALSLAPLGDAVLSRLSDLTSLRAVRAAALAVLAVGLFAISWNLRALLRSANYRPQAAMWAEIGECLGADARVVALAQDYGMRLTYWGWLAPSPWPTTGDLTYHAIRGAQAQFDDRFARLTQNRDYFLVTDFQELDRQPELKQRLLSTCLVIHQGQEYLICELDPPHPD